MVAGLRFRRLKVSHLYDLEQPEEPQEYGLSRPHRVQGGGPEHVRGHLVGVLEVALREDEEAAGLECLVDGREVREGVPRVLEHVDDEQRVEVVCGGQLLDGDGQEVHAPPEEGPVAVGAVQVGQVPEDVGLREVDLRYAEVGPVPHHVDELGVHADADLDEDAEVLGQGLEAAKGVGELSEARLALWQREDVVAARVCRSVVGFLRGRHVLPYP